MSFAQRRLEDPDCAAPFEIGSKKFSSPQFPENQATTVLLCIDDNEDVLECVKSFLETFGYSVLTAASGGKGLELTSKHSVDVVIFDYFMPEMNGHEIAIEMRRLRPLNRCATCGLSSAGLT